MPVDSASSRGKYRIKESTTMVNPFAGNKWFVDSSSKSAQKINELLATVTHSPPTAAEKKIVHNANILKKISSHAQADWFDGKNPGIKARVDARVTQITAAGKLPILVAYFVPNRDCGGASSGGAQPSGATPADVVYAAWIAEFAAGIGNREAVVILEPDALSQAGPNNKCAPLRAARCALIKSAIQTLKANPNTAVYVDGGNALWVPPADMAKLLNEAGVAGADGFSVNVSGYVPTPESVAYGKSISALVGNKPFIVDTSRNGVPGVKAGEFCNLPNMGLGKPPTTATEDPLCHAYVWVKRPGESDGTCNNGLNPGQFMLDYALMLCENAVF